ncbi:hypothetical protein KUL72_20970 [Bradyrhizobium arachidis]|uniref:hypothetical protein n=1 Tax=Bradyrhizobium arachidis TaxID=858423 RepID=UPI0021620A23|nr:hypothetical protein [Bradyrhizobium arachidis]UVO33987.1 hypothetical protein KUL72_20970 [Bradyrhizobium arachidis]
MTQEQVDMLQTLNEHGGNVGAVSYRLTFSPELQKWASANNYVIRQRNTFQITVTGAAALAAVKARVRR